MKGFVSQRDPESRDGQIRACPQNQFYAVLGADNPDVTDQLDSIYPNGFSANSSCPGPPNCAQVTFDPSPDDTAQNVSITIRGGADAHQLAQQAGFGPRCRCDTARRRTRRNGRCPAKNAGGCARRCSNGPKTSPVLVRNYPRVRAGDNSKTLHRQGKSGVSP
jgi:hypothetical protein